MSLRTACCGVVLLSGLIGCQPGNSGTSTKMTGQAPTPTEMAAYAGRHNYPSSPATDDLRIAAIVSTDKNSIRLYNFSNEPLGEVDVWVNGAFVHHIVALPAKGS